jgi:AcrR family transcriptional regulator
MPRVKKSTQGTFETRKIPSQTRARQTVAAIKLAVLQLAESRGFDNITIADIADGARISKGALYQYFSGREAIYLNLFEDASAEMTDVMKTLYLRILDVPVKDGVARVLRRHLNLVRQHRLVLLVMPQQLPELNLAHRPITYENLIARFTRNYIEEMSPGLPAKEIDYRTFFTHEIAKSCIYRFVSDPPEKLADRPFIDKLATIISDLITAP